jgi:hypothetical protein
LRFGANLLALTLSKPGKTSVLPGRVFFERGPRLAIWHPSSLTTQEALELENHSKWRLH